MSNNFSSYLHLLEAIENKQNNAQGADKTVSPEQSNPPPENVEPTPTEGAPTPPAAGTTNPPADGAEETPPTPEAEPPTQGDATDPATPPEAVETDPTAVSSEDGDSDEEKIKALKQYDELQQIKVLKQNIKRAKIALEGKPVPLRTLGKLENSLKKTIKLYKVIPETSRKKVVVNLKLALLQTLSKYKK